MTTGGGQATKLVLYLPKLDAVLLAAPCSVLQGEFIYLIHSSLTEVYLRHEL
jgi:hypothetical protein